MRRLRRRLTMTAGGEEGSILPLTIGCAALCLVVVLVCVDATSLYLGQRRLDALADAAALAGADGFALLVDGGAPRAELDDVEVHAQAAALLSTAGVDVALVSAGTPDGVSARVTLAGTWHPPLPLPFVPLEVALEATATSRTALR